jgi:dTDP-4-amino-4,6-dideoxygalactose transaminase
MLSRLRADVDHTPDDGLPFDVPRRDSYLVFGKPLIGEEEIEEVVATLRSGWIGTGPKTHRFENEFAAYVGAPGALGVNSCTAALHLAVRVADIGPGDEVIVPAMTFVATANIVVHAGAVPVLVDVDPDTGCLDPDALAAALSPRTRAVIPVHYAGRACEMDAIGAIAAAAGLTVIEDCAHAIETTYHGRHAGTMGAFGAFSFYATKNLVTGEGGMLVSADAELAARARTLSLHGLSADAWARFSSAGYRHYEAVEAGFKSNMTDIQASLGLHQLARIEANLVRRDEIWARYDEAFADLPLQLPAPTEPGTRHARHLYTVLVDDAALYAGRDDILSALHRQNVGSGVHYRAVHLHPFYRDRFGYRPEMLPHAAHLSDRTLSLPLSAQLSDADVDDVIAAVRRTLQHYRRPNDLLLRSAG